MDGLFSDDSPVPDENEQPLHLFVDEAGDRLQAMDYFLWAVQRFFDVLPALKDGDSYY